MEYLQPAAPVRRPSCRRRSDSSFNTPQQPQPITSIHFDSDEFDSTLPDRDDNVDGATWGLDANRCMFETTFPVHDRRQAPPAVPHHVDDEQEVYYQSSGVDEEYAEQPRPRQRLRRWRTLEDIHSSTDNIAAADDDGSGDTKHLWTAPTQNRRTPPDYTSTKSRSISTPNRSIVGFYVDTDGDSGDASFEDETVEEVRRDDGAGDRWFDNSRTERLQLEVGSEDWLDVQHERNRSHGHAELMFHHPSPRRTSIQSSATAPYRLNQQSGRTLTATSVAGPTVTAIRRNEGQQPHQSAIQTTNSTSNNQRNAAETNPNQDTDTSPSWLQIALHVLPLILVILLAGTVSYKYARPVPKPQLSLPQTEPSLFDKTLWYMATYMSCIFNFDF